MATRSRTSAPASPARPATKAAKKSPAPARKRSTQPEAAPVTAQRSAAPQPTEPPVKTLPAKPVKPVKAEKVKKTEKPAKAADKAKKPKLVRDSFTIPKPEYEVIAALKLRAAKLGQTPKKSELLRAGLKALAAMDDATLVASLSAVPTIKTGRPAA